LLQSVLGQYPEERELHERVRLYLRICQRQREPEVKSPQTPDERVYAATLAMNRGAYDEALTFLHAVGEQVSDHEAAQYMLAVVHTLRGDPDAAFSHLRRAIELNPDNRGLARQDPELETLRNLDGVRTLLDSPGTTRRRPRARLAR
jgi:tetratricopeptide (TPR) repeat protein